MGRSYECSVCEHVQVVGVVENGLSGFADPQAVCGACGTRGSFRYGPGYQRAVNAHAKNFHEAMERIKALPPSERSAVANRPEGSDAQA